jgi:RHS repeat-associated protein
MDRFFHAGLLGIVAAGAASVVGCEVENGRGTGEAEGVRTSEKGVTTAGQALQLTGTDVGTVSGDLSVTPRGVASYVVPIWTPQGRSAGATPELALAYSSAGDDSEFGRGWSLRGGLSQIRHCGGNSQRMRRARPLRIGYSERLCLDDMPLVLVAGTPGVGAEYRTEPDTFRKIVIDAGDSLGPSQISVYSRDGLIHTYGTLQRQYWVYGLREAWSPSDGTRTADIANTPALTQLGLLRSSVRDRFANTVSYKYSHPTEADVANGYQDPLLTTIEYVDVGGSPTRVIDFKYDPRPDPLSVRVRYLGGFQFQRRRLLKSIDVRVAKPNAALVSVRFYELTHATSPDTKNLLLKEIKECDGNPATVTGRSCKKPTILTYETGSDAFDDFATGITDLRSSSDGPWWTLRAADINNDGRDDLVYRARPSGAPVTANFRWFYRLSTGAGFGAATSMSLAENRERGDAVVGDFANNDGRPDVAIPESADRFAYYSNGSGGFSLVGASSTDSTARTGAMFVGDFAGKSQRLLVRPLDIGNLGYRSFTGGTMTAYKVTGSYVAWPTDWSTQGWNTYAFDFDGDGALELAGHVTGEYLSYGRQQGVPAPVPPDPGIPGFEQLETTLLRSAPGDLVKYIVFDHNGDGLPDVLRLRQGRAVPDLIINSGNGFARPSARTELTGTTGNIKLGTQTSWWDLTDPGVRVLDFDGDGRQDIMLVDNGVARNSGSPGAATRSSVAVLLSRPTGFVVKNLAIPIGREAEGGTPPSSSSVHNYKQSVLLDVNGDNLMDLVQISAADNSLHLYRRQGRPRDMLTAIKDGMGKKISITYLPMTDSNVYTPGTSCASPQICQRAGRWLVRSCRVDNGVGTGQNEFQYKYEDGRTDSDGAGDLGFARWTMTDVAASTTVTEEFDLTSRGTVSGVDGQGNVTVYSKLGVPTRRTEETIDSASSFTRRLTTTLSYDFVTTNGGKSYYTRPTLAATTAIEIRSGVTKQLGTSEQGFLYLVPAETDYGNLSRAYSFTTTPGGSANEEWRFQYDNYPSTWLVGLEKSRDLISRSTNGATVELVLRQQLLERNSSTGAIDKITIEPAGVVDHKQIVEFTRNSYGQVVTVKRSDTSAAPNTLTRTEAYAYDTQSVHPRVYTSAAGHNSIINTDPALGLPTSVTDPNGFSRGWDYDGFGRVRRITAQPHGGQSISYAREYEPGSPTAEERYVTKVTTIRDGGGETRELINRLGRPIRRESKNLDGTFSFSTLTYNDLGLMDSVTRPALTSGAAGAKTSFTFDELGRMKSRARPEEGFSASDSAVTSVTSTVAYDGLTSTITDDFGRQTRLTEDSLGRVIKSEAKNDAGSWLATDYTYGPFGDTRFIVRRNAGATQSRTTEIRYDTLGRRTYVSDPDTGAFSYAYNAFGELRVESDANSAYTYHYRDGAGRPIWKNDVDGWTYFEWDTAVNGRGKLARADSPTTARSFFYDASGGSRVTSETWTVQGNSYQFEYTYGTDGRLDRMRYPNIPGFARFEVRNAFDADTGEVGEVLNHTSGFSYWKLNTTDVDGQIKKETFGNALFTDYAYSARTGRVSSIKTAKPGATPTTLREWSYDYWQDGNLRRRSDLVPSAKHERFEYDALDRVKRWLAAGSSGTAMSGGWTVSFTADDFGNLTRRNFVGGSATGGGAQDLSFTYHSGTSRVATAPWGSFSYDMRGNQIGRPDGEAITYSGFDLPRTVTGPRAATFSYDAFGARTEKRKSSTDNTVYIGDLYEKRQSGSNVDHVFYVPGPRGPVAQVMRRQGGAESVLYTHTDRLGSVDTVSNSSGAAPESTRRDPFGNKVTSFNQPTIPNPVTPGTNLVRLGFTGHEQDDDQGLVNMRGRVYDPRLGRFLTPDPIISAPLSGQSYNRYAYVLNNPLKYTDPSGLRVVIGSCVSYGMVRCYEGTERGRVYVVYGPDGGPVAGGQSAAPGSNPGQSPPVVANGSRHPDATFLPTDYVPPQDGGNAPNEPPADPAAAPPASTTGDPSGTNTAPPGAPTTSSSTGPTQAAAIPLAPFAVMAAAGAAITVWGVTKLQNILAGYLGSTYGPASLNSESTSWLMSASTFLQASANQMNKEVQRGQAPADVARVDRAHPPEDPQDHAHLKDGTRARKDGTTNPENASIPQAVRKWLAGHGWNY